MRDDFVASNNVNNTLGGSKSQRTASARGGGGGGGGGGGSGGGGSGEGMALSASYQSAPTMGVGGGGGSAAGLTLRPNLAGNVNNAGHHSSPGREGRGGSTRHTAAVPDSVRTGCVHRIASRNAEPRTPPLRHSLPLPWHPLRRPHSAPMPSPA